MIPKYYTCIVVSCVKAPMIKIMLLPFFHAISFVRWGGNLISIRDNLDDMPPLY